MARRGSTQQQQTEGPETVDLVSPDKQQTRKGVVVGSKEEVGLRWDGYLPPEQQELEAPEKPSEAPLTPTTTA